ncbi:MAG: hypothetical protein IPL35_10350 [Sphingobacteriales bacterium]|nr:hypothetical protein [Sphingobacteriales bacterium]
MKYLQNIYFYTIVGAILVSLFAACSNQEYKEYRAQYEPLSDKYAGVHWTPMDSTPVSKRYAAKLNNQFLIKWVWLDSDKRIVREYVELDKKRDGLYTEYYSNGGKRRFAQYADGLKNGVEYEWYPSGELYKKTNYLDGRKNGEYMGWYKNGNPQYYGILENERPKGEMKYWNEEGESQTMMTNMKEIRDKQ